MGKILLPHGRLQSISAKMNLSASTCSKYLKGYYDSSNPNINERAEAVRAMALRIGGVEEK